MDSADALPSEFVSIGAWNRTSEGACGGATTKVATPAGTLRSSSATGPMRATQSDALLRESLLPNGGALRRKRLSLDAVDGFRLSSSPASSCDERAGSNAENQKGRRFWYRV